MEIENKIEKKLKLKAKSGRSLTEFSNNNIKVVFRVYTGDYAVPDAIYISGSHEQLGQMVPNKIKMYDDGTHGDQIAGDNVWSYIEEFGMGEDIYYIYTNSGQYNKWNGLDVIGLRHINAKAVINERILYAQIDTFGKIYMKADPWHTNSLGYERIARAIINNLKTLDNFKKFIKQSYLN